MFEDPWFKSISRKDDSSKTPIDLHQLNIDVANKKIEINSNDSESYELRGFNYYHLEDYENAIKDLNRVIELNPNESEHIHIYYYRGHSKYELGDYENAIKDLNKSLELDHNESFQHLSEYIYYYRGLSKYALEDYENAIKDFDQLLELQPNISDLVFKKGLYKYELGDYENAIKDLNKSIELEPDDSDAYKFRGLSKFKLEDYENAIKDLNKLLELEPDDSEVYEFRGISKFNLEDYENAIKDLNKLLELDPDNSVAYKFRGISKFKIDDDEDAIKDLNKSIELDPDDSEVYKCKGLSKYILEDYENAIKDLNKSIEIDPNDIGSYNFRALCKFNLGFYESSINDFNKSLKINHNNLETINIVKECTDILTSKKLYTFKQDESHNLSFKRSVLKVNEFERSSIYNLSRYSEYSLREKNKNNITDFYENTKKYFKKSTFSRYESFQLPNWHLESFYDFYNFIELLKPLEIHSNYRSKEELIEILSIIMKEEIKLIIVKDTKDTEYSSIVALYIDKEAIILNADYFLDIDTLCASLTHEIVHYIQKGNPLGLEIADSIVYQTSMSETYNKLYPQQFRCELECQTYEYSKGFIPNYFKYFRNDKQLLKDKFGVSNRRKRTIDWICENKILPPFDEDSNPNKRLDFKKQIISFAFDK